METTKCCLPKQLLLELTSLDELSFPVAFSNRIKFTCLEICSKYLLIGSSSGSVYSYSRYIAKHKPSITSNPVRVVACNAGAVVQLKISPDERNIAVATGNGTVVVIRLPEFTVAEVFSVTTNDVNVKICCLCWSVTGQSIFCGTSDGRIIQCAPVSDAVKPFDVLSQNGTKQILKVDESSVVQLDSYQNFLLVSTRAFTFLFDLLNKNLVKIGTKSRNGVYGACFIRNAASGTSSIVCSRPAGRLWEANLSGKVYNTHQFEKLSIFPCAPPATFRQKFHAPIPFDAQNSVKWAKLYPMRQCLVMSHSTNFIVIADVSTAEIILACPLEIDINGIAVQNNDIFILSSDGNLRKYTLVPVKKAIDKACARKIYELGYQIVTIYDKSGADQKTELWNEETLTEMKNYFASKGDSKLCATLSLIQNLIPKNFAVPNSSETLNFYKIEKLETGVHRVLKSMQNSGYEDDFCFEAPKNTLNRRKSATKLLRNGKPSKLPNFPRGEKKFSNDFVPKNDKNSTQNSNFDSTQNTSDIPNEELNISVESNKKELNHISSRSKVQKQMSIDFLPNGDHNSTLILNSDSVQNLSDILDNESNLNMKSNKWEFSKEMVTSRSEGCLLKFFDENLDDSVPLGNEEDEDESLNFSSKFYPTDRNHNSKFGEFCADSYGDSNFCVRCGLHESWLFAAVLRDQFREFDFNEKWSKSVNKSVESKSVAVPSGDEEWADLLKCRLNSKLDHRSDTEGFDLLCVRCRMIFKTFSDLCKIKYDMSPKFLQNGADVRKLETQIHSDVNHLDRLVFCTKNETGLRQDIGPDPNLSKSNEEMFVTSIYCNPVYKSFYESVPFEDDLVETTQSWIDSFPLYLILAIMVETMGIEESLSVLNRHKIIDLPDSCWKFLASAKMLMNNERKPLPDEFLEILGKIPPSQSENIAEKGGAVIDCKHQQCNLCTLSLASDAVSSTVFVFVCGHAFHKVCLPHGSLSCPVCN